MDFVYTKGPMPAGGQYSFQQPPVTKEPQRTSWTQRVMVKLGLRVDPEVVTNTMRRDKFVNNAADSVSVAGLQGLQNGGSSVKNRAPEETLVHILHEVINS